jgi:hypothetical protein
MLPVHKTDDRKKAPAMPVVGLWAAGPTVREPKLPDRLRDTLRSRKYGRRTEQTCCHWVKRFIYFQHGHDPCPRAGQGRTRCTQPCRWIVSGLCSPYEPEASVAGEVRNWLAGKMLCKNV